LIGSSRIEACQARSHLTTKYQIADPEDDDEDQRSREQQGRQRSAKRDLEPKDREYQAKRRIQESDREIWQDFTSDMTELRSALEASAL
jgi:hypothetical protein